MTLGGRAAEEIVFGEITTGASNDLEKVTATAKQMVMRFGMSEKLGPRVFGHDHGQPFLGREFSSEPDYSDEIAREIDDEIRRIVEAAHQRAKDILTEHRESLERISKILLKRETIEEEEFAALLAGKTEEEVFGPDEPTTPPELPAQAAAGRRGRREGPRPLPRPGLAGGAARGPRPRLAREAEPRLSRPAAMRRAWTVMGVVNVTPDSFSDGGLWLDAERGGRARRASCTAQGADDPRRRRRVDAARAPSRSARDEELRARRPRARGACASGAGAVLASTPRSSRSRARRSTAGATYVNDVTALRDDPAIAGARRRARRDCCLMHMQGEPRTMQDDPRYDDVVDDVRAFLEERVGVRGRARASRAERIQLDPGIGFGKTLEHNLELLRRLDEIVALGFPVVVGVSRKSFLGALTGRDDAADRVAGDGRDERPRARARRARLPRPRRRADASMRLTVAAATLRGR